MTEESNEVADIADRYFAAHAAADENAMRALLADDFSGRTTAMGGMDLSADILVMGAKWEAESLDIRLEDIRRNYWATGFVQQCAIRGTAPSGDEIDIATCMVAEVIDGQFTRMDEYVAMPEPTSDS
ncbi:MAG: hypothetical protein P8J50_02990 [Acidimicrobiales bacterium]|nr:hypothetical protein [Acidimicrobiales bacterium]